MKEKNKKNKIKLYITENCSFCFSLKEFLKEKNIEFEEINVSQDENARVKLTEKLDKMGIRGSLPIMEIDDEIVIGFDRKRIYKLLNIKE